MEITTKKLNKKDFNAVRKFAVTGMNLEWYTKNKLETFLYSHYMLSLELMKATKILGAYIDDRPVGVLLVNIFEDKKAYKSFWRSALVYIGNLIMKLYEASNVYDKINKEMITNFTNTYKPDGELTFFVVDPEITRKGIGSILLKQLEQDEDGKLIYLYSDSGASHEFYIHRGFQESGKYEAILKRNNKEVFLTCYLYSKTLKGN